MILHGITERIDVFEGPCQRVFNIRKSILTAGISQKVLHRGMWKVGFRIVTGSRKALNHNQEWKATVITANSRKQNVRQYPTPALEKGLDILELFASEPGGLTKSDVARRLGRTASEIFRMLLCLEERGYISQSRDGERYRLTLRLFKLAQEHPPTKRMISEALPIMQQVAHEANQSAHLGVLEGGHVVIIAHVDSPVSSGFYVKTGAVVDLMHSAVGQVILAYQQPEVCSRAVETWREQKGERPSRDLTAHLARIRHRGYEERPSHEVDGMINISFPVLDDRGRAIAALTVPFLQRIGDRTTPATVREILEKATVLLSEAIKRYCPPRKAAS